ncbi:unnamed protein product, partial [marine sediment metagenome]
VVPVKIKVIDTLNLKINPLRFSLILKFIMVKIPKRV